MTALIVVLSLECSCGAFSLQFHCYVLFEDVGSAKHRSKSFKSRNQSLVHHSSWNSKFLNFEEKNKLKSEKVSSFEQCWAQVVSPCDQS